MKTWSFSLDKGTFSKGFTLPAVKDPKRTAVIIFAASSFMQRQELFDAIGKQYEGARIIGCSTSGEVFQDRVQDESVVITVAEFENTDLALASVPVLDPTTSLESGKDLALKLLDRGLSGVIVFLDGLKANASTFVEGMVSVLPKGVAVTGGVAGDSTNFETAWVLHEGRPATGYATALAFYGDSICFEHAVRGGWNPFGPERKVTRSKDNVLFELDGQPALALYKKYLGERAAELPASALSFPLKIQVGGKTEFMRCVQDIDEGHQSITCGGNVPEGATAQLMRASFDQLVDGVSGGDKVASRSDDPALAIVVSCIGRRLVLGQRIEEEVEASLEQLPKGVRQVGFYSYGEIAPSSTGEKCQLHNQAMVLTVLQEKAKA